MTTPNDVEATQVGLTVGAPVMPRVNLMPPEIAEAARFRRFQFAMGGAVVAAVAVVGLLYTQAHHSADSAQAQLEQSQVRHAALQSQLAGLQSVQDVYTQVAAKQATLSRAMGDEIRWSTYLNDLSLRMPDHVWLTSVSATETAASATAPAPTTSTAAAGLGTVNFSGVAFSHDDVATWLEVLAKEHGYTNAYFTNSSETKIGPRGVVNFTSSVTLDDKAKSGRYSKPAGS